MLPFPTPHKTLLQLLGPTVIFVALSLNGGEMLLWPDLVSRYGLQLLWIVPFILLFQYFVNLEIERYTITTGQNTLIALTSMYPLLKPFFFISIIISLVWPAWILISGNIISITFGIKNEILISMILLISLILLWNFKKSYLIIENITKIGLSILLILIIYIFTTKFNYLTFINSFSPTLIPDSKDKILYLSALAFGGVSGVLNLVQSNWVKNKKYGVNIYSDITKIDYKSYESEKNWKKWFSLISKEHFILFFCGNIFGIFLISILSIFTIKGSGLKGFAILKYQVETLKNENIILGMFWGLCIFLLFFMAQMTILDASGHLLNSLTKGKISSSKWSQIVGFLALLILGIIFIRPEFNLPSNILEISASLSALIMGVYPIMILRLNSLTLPFYARPKLVNYFFVTTCSLFYLFLVIFTIFR
jgi:hypothetical protein